MLRLCTERVAERVSGATGKVFMFFDEIQEVQGWEKSINSLRVEYDCDIYITGSNARLLSGELAAYLAGRYVEFVIYPLSFREFLSMLSLQPSANIFCSGVCLSSQTCGQSRSLQSLPHRHIQFCYSEGRSEA